MLQMVSGEGVPCGGGGGGGKRWVVIYSGTCIRSLKNDFVSFIRAVVYLFIYIFLS